VFGRPHLKTAPALWEGVAGAATFSRFVSTIPRERWIRLSATLQVPKTGPDVGLAGLRRPLANSTNFRVLFTIGQTLRPFPALIGKPDGYPLPYLAV
jgi:hypothetical protein